MSDVATKVEVAMSVKGPGTTCEIIEANDIDFHQPWEPKGNSVREVLQKRMELIDLHDAWWATAVLGCILQGEGRKV